MNESIILSKQVRLITARIDLLEQFVAKLINMENPEIAHQIQQLRSLVADHDQSQPQDQEQPSPLDYSESQMIEAVRHLLQHLPSPKA